MTTLIDHQNVTLQTGVTTLGPAVVPDGLTFMTVRLARCTTATPTLWPNASTTVQVQFQISLDNGVTWLPVGAFGAPGGIVQADGVHESVESFATFQPIPLGHNRQAQATITVVNGPLVSKATVEVG